MSNAHLKNVEVTIIDPPKHYLTGKEVLITGGTGSLGKTLIKLLLERDEGSRPRGIRIYSRDELKQWELRRSLPPNAPVSYLIGDVSDYKRLKRAMSRVDVVIHTAAMKHIDSCEENPIEALRINVRGAESVVNAAIDCGVERVLNVSTDKAVNPINFYGATKMLAERLFTEANTYTGGRTPYFSCVRYGNVLASRGSVAHIFKEQVEAGERLTITHKDMTRFWIGLKNVANFLLTRLEEDMEGGGGKTYVPVMPSMSIIDMAQAMGGVGTKMEFTGVRSGEKLHECLITAEEDEHTQLNEHASYYIINKKKRVKEVGEGVALCSNNNPYGRLTKEQLIKMLEVK
jgi:UDP-N-acetylglucosamine 4,6-dehydratase